MRGIRADHMTVEPPTALTISGLKGLFSWVTG